jgi:hypothetical protein
MLRIVARLDGGPGSGAPSKLLTIRIVAERLPAHHLGAAPRRTPPSAELLSVVFEARWAPWIAGGARLVA